MKRQESGGEWESYLLRVFDIKEDECQTEAETDGQSQYKDRTRD